MYVVFVIMTNTGSASSENSPEKEIIPKVQALKLSWPEMLRRGEDVFLFDKNDLFVLEKVGGYIDNIHFVLTQGQGHVIEAELINILVQNLDRLIKKTNGAMQNEQQNNIRKNPKFGDLANIKSNLVLARFFIKEVKIEVE